MKLLNSLKNEEIHLNKKLIMTLVVQKNKLKDVLRIKLEIWKKQFPSLLRKRKKSKREENINLNNLIRNIPIALKLNNLI